MEKGLGRIHMIREALFRFGCFFFKGIGGSQYFLDGLTTIAERAV